MKLNLGESDALVRNIVMANNPWESFTYQGVNSENFLGGDEMFINAYKEFYKEWVKKSKNSERRKSELHLELFPEPFEGDPNKASIYLLGANPGYDETDKDWCAKLDESEIFLPLMKENLQHKTPFVFFNSALEKHGGYKWWSSHIDDGLKEKIFNIEYFPYHSQKADGLKAFLDAKSDIAPCESERYANELILQAMKEEKCIIITRLETYWFRRIKELEQYQNLFILLNHQTAAVKKGNVVKYNKFVSLKSNSWTQI